MDIQARLETVLSYLRRRKVNYKLAFGSPAGQAVLRDLGPFCRATESAAVPGDRDKTYILIGRREVWLRIQQHLNLTDAQLLSIFGGKDIIVNEVEEEDNG
jgi:hypothetical protein